MSILLFILFQPVHIVQILLCQSNSIQNKTTFIFKIKVMALRYQGQQEQRSIQVQCREGPIADRKCTDVFCCIFYLLLIGSIIFLAFFASAAAQKSQIDVENQLKQVSGAQPLLAISQATLFIILSLTFVIAISLLLVITSFIIPSISAYIFIPLLLILMLLLGAGFLYRYFGNRLPFVNKDLQSQYAGEHSVASLIVGIAFLAGFVISVIVLTLKQQRIKHISAILKLSKICFWENVYMFLISISLSAVSIAALYINLRLLQIAALQQDGQQIINSNIFSVLILVEMLWTHGYLQAYSDFLFQSIAIHWYFNQIKYPGGYSKIGKNLCPSLGLSFRHIGTISFGWILAYIPESLNVLIHQCEQKAEGCYSVCCVFHKCACQHLSKYCYIGTIMYSQSFCKASTIVKDIRLTAKHTFPELYMIGNFYITLMKIFIVLTSLIICYFLIAQEKAHLYANILNLMAPLIVTFLGSLQIANHFMDSTGLVGDTIYLTYVIDYNNESTNFGNLNAQHCPRQAYEVIRQAKINKYTVYD